MPKIYYNKKIPADENTLALLHFDDENNIAKDECGNSWITHGTAPTISTAQSKFGGKSLYITGTNSAIKSTNFVISDRQNFTVDFWVCMTAQSQVHTCAFTLAQPETRFLDGSGLGICFYEQQLQLYWSSGSGGWNIATGQVFGNFTLNTWYHVALVKSGSSIYMFWNGTLVNTITNSNTFYDDQKTVYIGNSYNGGRTVTAFFDEFRISNCARWTANFTPPTEPYHVAEYIATKSIEFGESAIEEKILALLHFDDENNITKDEYGNTWTTYGSPAVSSDKSVTGGKSLYLDGSSYVRHSDISQVITGNEWTISCYFCMTKTPTTNHRIFQTYNTNYGSSGTGTNYWIDLSITARSNPLVVFYDNDVTVNTTIELNTWYHAAYTYDGTTLRFYLNGELKAERVHNIKLGSTFTIGGTSNNKCFWNGYIDEFQILNYVQAFSTVQLRKGGKNYYSPLVDVTSSRASDLIIRHGGQNYAVAEIPGTQVGNLDLYDLSGNTWQDATQSGGTAPTISAVQSKFGDTSIYFTGKNSCFLSKELVFPDRKCFTVDFWVCLTAASTSNVPVICWAQPETSNPGTGGFVIDFYGRDFNLFCSSGSSGWDIAWGKQFGTLTLNRWYHAAISRTGDNIYMFLDGQLVNSFTSSKTFYDTQKTLWVGHSYGTGWNRTVSYYLDEIRISSVCRWTENFTPPTKQYAYDDNTLVLLRAK